MNGRRVYANEAGFITELQAGDYGWSPKFNYWIVATPNNMHGNLKNHKVTEHEDKTITVEPSILVTQGEREEWHGFLEHGVWRSV